MLCRGYTLEDSCLMQIILRNFSEIRVVEDSLVIELHVGQVLNPERNNIKLIYYYKLFMTCINDWELWFYSEGHLMMECKCFCYYKNGLLPINIKLTTVNYKSLYMGVHISTSFKFHFLEITSFFFCLFNLWLVIMHPSVEYWRSVNKGYVGFHFREIPINQ